MALHYLDTAGLASRAGLSASTIRDYQSRHPHLLPAPDILLGDRPGWLPATVDAWFSARPGRGRSAHGSSAHGSDAAIVGQLRVLASLRADVTDRIDCALIEARLHGQTWATIGDALGVTRQAVLQYYRYRGLAARSPDQVTTEDQAHRGGRDAVARPAR